MEETSIPNLDVSFYLSEFVSSEIILKSLEDITKLRTLFYATNALEAIQKTDVLFIMVDLPLIFDHYIGNSLDHSPAFIFNSQNMIVGILFTELKNLLKSSLFYITGINFLKVGTKLYERVKCTHLISKKKHFFRQYIKLIYDNELGFLQLDLSGHLDLCRDCIKFFRKKMQKLSSIKKMDVYISTQKGMEQFNEFFQTAHIPNVIVVLDFNVFDRCQLISLFARNVNIKKFGLKSFLKERLVRRELRGSCLNYHRLTANNNITEYYLDLGSLKDDELNGFAEHFLDDRDADIYLHINLFDLLDRLLAGERNYVYLDVVKEPWPHSAIEEGTTEQDVLHTRTVYTTRTRLTDDPVPQEVVERVELPTISQPFMRSIRYQRDDPNQPRRSVALNPSVSEEMQRSQSEREINSLIDKVIESHKIRLFDLSNSNIKGEFSRITAYFCERLNGNNQAIRQIMKMARDEIRSSQERSTLAPQIFVRMAESSWGSPIYPTKHFISFIDFSNNPLFGEIDESGEFIIFSQVDFRFNEGAEPFTQFTIHSSPIMGLFEYLSSNGYLISLKLNNCNMDTYNLTLLFQSIRTNSWIQELEVDGSFITKDVTKTMYNYFHGPGQKSLISLTIGFMDVAFEYLFIKQSDYHNNGFNVIKEEKMVELSPPSGVFVKRMLVKKVFNTRTALIKEILDCLIRDPNNDAEDFVLNLKRFGLNNIAWSTKIRNKTYFAENMQKEFHFGTPFKDPKEFKKKMKAENREIMTFLYKRIRKIVEAQMVQIGSSNVLNPQNNQLLIISLRNSPFDMRFMHLCKYLFRHSKVMFIDLQTSSFQIKEIARNIHQGGFLYKITFDKFFNHITDSESGHRRPFLIEGLISNMQKVQRLFEKRGKLWMYHESDLKYLKINDQLYLNWTHQRARTNSKFIETHFSPDSFMRQILEVLIDGITESGQQFHYIPPEPDLPTEQSALSSSLE